jgi:hypothetical protein
LLGCKSWLFTSNRLLLYKVILKPIWTCGIQLWGSASTSNIEIHERYQSKALRMLTDAPWYVPNVILRQDLQTPSVKEEIRPFSSQYSSRLQTSQQPRSSTYGTTRTQATGTTPASWSDLKISRLNVCMLFPSCHTWLLSLLIMEGHHWVPLPMSHSRNPHTNLLNVFIQIANNRGILKKKRIVSCEYWSGWKLTQTTPNMTDTRPHVGNFLNKWLFLS